MTWDWAFAQQGYGVILLKDDGTAIGLEFNEFLRRIASGWVQADDQVVSGVFTNGWRKRAGDLRVFALVCSGQVRTEDLPLRTPGGVLVTGEEAWAHLRLVERLPSGRLSEPDREAATLLRAASKPHEAGELLRAIAPAPVRAKELLRAAVEPTSTPVRGKVRPRGVVRRPQTGSHRENERSNKQE